MTATVLVIDDDADMRLLAQLMLEDAGYRVTATGAATEGLDVFATQPVDVVLLDVRLHGTDGWDMLDRLQQIDDDARVVMFSAHVSDADKARAAAAGSHGYVTKPFTARDLVAAVGAAFDGR